MWPRIHLPGTDVTIATYHLLNVAGWLAFWYVGVALTSSRPGFRRHWSWLFVGMVVSVIGSSLLAFLIHRDAGASSRGQSQYQPSKSGYFGGPLLFLAWTGGYVLIQRIRACPFLDAFAIAYSLSRAISKTACLAAGCCYGPPTGSFPGLAFAAVGDPTRRHPTQLYEAAFHLLTALGLGLLYARGWLKGRLVMLFGLAYGMGHLAGIVGDAGRLEVKQRVGVVEQAVWTVPGA